MSLNTSDPAFAALPSTPAASGSKGTAPTRKRTVKVFFYKVLILHTHTNLSSIVIGGLDKIRLDQAAGSNTAYYQRGNKVGTNIGFIKHHSLPDIFTFLFYKGKLDIGDRAIVNLANFAAEPLDSRVRLDPDESLGRRVIGAYDARHNVLALESARTPNKTDLESYLTDLIGRNVRLNFILDVNKDNLFNGMNVKRFTMQVAIPNPQKYAPLYGDSEAKGIRATSDLIEYASKFDGDMVNLDIYSDIVPDSEGAKSYLRKEAIREEVSFLERLLKTEILPKRPKAVATGSVEISEDRIINNRAIDLIDGFLIWQDDLNLPNDSSAMTKEVEDLLIRIVEETREFYRKEEL